MKDPATDDDATLTLTGAEVEAIRRYLTRADDARSTVARDEPQPSQALVGQRAVLKLVLDNATARAVRPVDGCEP